MKDAPGVYDALPFLIANTKQVMGLEELPEEPFINTAGLNVVYWAAATPRWTVCVPHCATAR
ncbi:oxidoreductase [Escherichia coli]|uniref:Oxidoreductase n=1 Tax=Escherichia coli TaxID=562 RepID=A0A2X1NNM6_ECOLX|nr:oxidoreductase [Escherichia coli]